MNLTNSYLICPISGFSSKYFSPIGKVYRTAPGSNV